MFCIYAYVKIPFLEITTFYFLNYLLILNQYLYYKNYIILISKIYIYIIQIKTNICVCDKNLTYYIAILYRYINITMKSTFLIENKFFHYLSLYKLHFVA